jgi:transcription elongation factor Elf1
MNTKYDIPIPDYITITEINGGLLVQDSRTNLAGKIRDIKRLDKEQINWQLEKFLHEFDNKHNKSLPIEERKGTNTPTDFTCPHCFNKETTKIIKTPKIGTYRAGMYYARKTYVNVSLQNVYECSVCKNQFTEEELNQAISKVDKSNRHEILFQQLQDKIITDNEYQDKRFELEIGMTKSEYKLKLK